MSSSWKWPQWLVKVNAYRGRSGAVSRDQHNLRIHNQQVIINPGSLFIRQFDKCKALANW